MTINKACDPWKRGQHGSSLVEMWIVGGTLVLVGLFTLQLGLLYHAKTTLNYATFEAARTGAVNNARVDRIREELGKRLAPLQGGDGSASGAAVSSFWSTFSLYEPLNTRLEFINPTREAFDDWAVSDPDTGVRFIPVNHLRHQSYAVGISSGLSLRDANILKIQVIHGVKLRVPVVGRALSMVMRVIDPENSGYYLRDRWPISSVATVRMQTDSFESEVLSSTSDAGDVGPIASGGSAGISVDANADLTDVAQSGEYVEDIDVAGIDESVFDSDSAVENSAAGETTSENDSVENNHSSETGDSDVQLVEHGEELLDENSPLTDQTDELVSAEDHEGCAEGYQRIWLSSTQPPEGAPARVSQALMSTTRFRQMVAMGY